MSKKNIWILTAAAIIGVAALLAGTFTGRHDEPGKAPLFLPGIYTCISLNEFCRIDDTLTIRRIRMGEDIYTVTRSTAFVRIREGNWAAPEYTHQCWKVRYQGDRKLVSFDGSDTMLYFPATNHLNKGYCFYEKIE
jgi:hypothetical protein